MAEITEGDFVLLGLFAALEERLSPRAIYDIGYFAKNPVEVGVAIQTQLKLQEIVHEYYGKNTAEEDPHPPHDHKYQEGPDGGTDWRNDPEASV